MQPNQNNFVTRLQHTFEKQPKLQTQCSEKVRKGTLNRVFDDLPDLLSQTEISEFTQQFKTVFQQIRQVPETQSINPNTFLNEQEKKLLLNWEKGIIQQAFSTLLTSAGEISPPLLAVMGWDEASLQKQLHVGELLCAYVGAVHQAITCQDAFMSLIENNQGAASAVFNFININYGALVQKQLREGGHDASDEKFTLRTILDLPKKHPEATKAVALGVAVSILSGVAAIGMAFFNDKPTNSRTSNMTPKPNSNPRGYQP